MIRQSFRRRLARVVPSCYQPATYAIASGAALMAFVLLWQPSPAPGELFRLQGSARLAVRFLAIPGILIFVWGAQAQRSFDPFGLRAIRIRLQQEGEPAAGLVTHGPYRWVRHPLYLGMLLFIWSSPHLTPDRLLFNVLWSAWIWLGARWEEKDLVADFGETYRAYQRAVPMLIPWRRTAPWEGDRSQPPPR